MSSRSASVAVVLFSCLALTAADARAGCQNQTDRDAFEEALRDTMRCAARRLRGRTCSLPVAPACASQELQRVVDLLGGLHDSAAPAGRARKCQAITYRAARKFVTRRMAERSAGITRQRSSARAFRIDNRCTVATVETAEGMLPRFGGPCVGPFEDPAGFQRGDRLRRCLRPALEEVVNDLLELPPVPPNVVLVVTDDQHPEAVNLMPDVLELAERGASFTNAFTTTPLCAPSRAGLLTGQHATNHGVTGNSAMNFDDSSTLATWFHAAGYRTALLGKYLNGYRFISPEVPQGWDEWRAFLDDNTFFDYSLNENGVVNWYGSSEADYATDVLADRALDFVNQSKDQPFFMYFAPLAPHSPSTPAPRHDGVLDGIAPWRPPSWFEDITDKPNWFRFVAVRTEEALIAHDPGIIDQRESLLSVDEAVRALTERLERLGLTDNTIFVFTADHGLLWGEHRWVGKQVPYEESVRIPLAISYPLRIPAGTVLDGAALNIDIAPTLTTFASIVPGHTPDGRSLTDLLAGAPDWRTDFLVQHFTNGLAVPPWDMLRTPQHTFVRHSSGEQELYDLVADPYQMTNTDKLPENAPLVAWYSARLDALLGP